MIATLETLAIALAAATQLLVAVDLFDWLSRTTMLFSSFKVKSIVTRALCFSSVIFSILATWFLPPRSWIATGAEIGMLLLCAIALAGYSVMVMIQDIGIPAVGGILPALTAKPWSFGVKRISSLLFGWLPLLFWVATIVRFYFDI